jgi:phosphoadenosine phosphosulfate reductase
MTYSKPKGYSDIIQDNLEKWKDTVIRNINIITEREKESVSLIQECFQKYNEYEPHILTSGGKDSSVEMYLVRKVKQDTHSYANNTTLDCADTYLHLKTIENLDIINPKEGFYQWRERMNFIPTRFARACCDIFKEGAMMDYLDTSKKMVFFLGMRNEESSNRSNYLDYWDNQKWSKEWKGCLPIRKWTELEIWLYIMYNNIPINEKYKKGYSRVGCAIACPYYTKSTWVLDDYWYPSMRKRWVDILVKDFKENNKAIIMNCTENEYISCWNGGTFRAEPTEGVILEFAQNNNLNLEIAEKYFNHICTCNKKVKQKEVLAMNMKFFGRNTNQFLCKKCLMKNLDINKEQWIEQVNKFKQQGCELF